MSESMKDKISKLLAKAERTTNEHEALAFREMAEKLMVKWGIEAAELESRGEVKPEEIITRKFDMTGIYHLAFTQFANSIVLGMGNLELLKSERHDIVKGKYKKIPQIYVIGHVSDVDRWEMMYTSLVMQCTTEMNRWWKNSSERHYLSSMEGFKARREFIMAFGRAVRDRLEIARAQEKRDGGISTGAELVLVSKQNAVTDWMHKQYAVTTGRSRMSGSHHGRAEGAAAGNRAGLGGNGIGGGRGQLGS